MLVVDASVFVAVVADGGPDGRRWRERLQDEIVAGPDLLRVEAVSALRRHLHAGRLTADQAAVAVGDALDFPVQVYPTAPLLPRVWELRDNLSAYDACYVALAEALETTLLTADRRLADAPGARCSIEVS